MKFENSSFFKKIKHHKLEMPYGNYYLYDNFFVGELNEGVHFDWNKAKEVVEKVIDFYGKDAKIGFISNRINSYSIDPHNWKKIEEEYDLIAGSAIVMYSSSTYMNASIEKQFAKKTIKRCMSLNEAIDWMINLKEIN